MSSNRKRISVTEAWLTLSTQSRADVWITVEDYANGENKSKERGHNSIVGHNSDFTVVNCNDGHKSPLKLI